MGKPRKISQRNIGMYPEDWVEVETLARVYSISVSAATRIIVDFWRRNRDPKDSKEIARLRELAKSYLREEITSNEFALEAGFLILAEI